ncbi:hypothetical protein UT300012_21630 [Paraclostridium bifermentans]
MERLILNVIGELDTMKLDIAKIRVNIMNEDTNPYAVTTEIASLRLRLDFAKRILNGVRFPNEVAVSVIDTVKKLEGLLNGLEEGRVDKRVKQSKIKQCEEL